MKRIIPILIALLLFAVQAEARSRTWYLYLNNDMTSAVTTQLGGGVSAMVVQGDGARSQGITLLHGLQYTDSGTWVAQIEDVTLSQAQLGLGGTLQVRPSP